MQASNGPTFGSDDPSRQTAYRSHNEGRCGRFRVNRGAPCTLSTTSFQRPGRSPSQTGPQAENHHFAVANLVHNDIAQFKERRACRSTPNRGGVATRRRVTRHTRRGFSQRPRPLNPDSPPIPHEAQYNEVRAATGGIGKTRDPVRAHDHPAWKGALVASAALSDDRRGRLHSRHFACQQRRVQL